jgi:hypothetical protein
MKLIDPATGQAVWDSNDPNAGPVPPAPEGRQWVRVDEPGDTMAPRRTAPGILDIGNGVTERLAFLNQTFNPVEGIGSAMRAGSRMVAPDQSYWDRIASLGEMASGVAGIAAPMAAAKAIGVPAASAMMEGLLGFSPAQQAAGDMARGFVADESGAFRLYQGSPHDFNAERLVRMPDGSTQYIVGRPDVLPDVPQGAEVLQDFPLGRQRMDKIGTGEGAQAYGPGLYGAEAEGVARGYRDQLSRPYLATSEGQNIAEKYGDDVANIFEMADGEPDDMRATVVRLRQIVKENLDDIGVDDVSQLKSEFYGDLPSTIIDFSNRADRLESLLNSGDVKLVNTGRMYELEVNANPEEFLDWDKPLSEQPQRVQDFANARWRQIYGRDPDPSIEGEYIAKMASPQGGIDSPDWLLRGGSGDAQRERLLEAGIPGVRYLDQGSRGAGDGSRNYVVFDENLINIVRKYGIAGAATMLGVSAIDVEQALAENLPPGQWDQLVVGPQ